MRNFTLIVHWSAAHGDTPEEAVSELADRYGAVARSRPRGGLAASSAALPCPGSRGEVGARAFSRKFAYIAGMTRAETIAALRNHAAAIRARGVTALYLFGSAARGEAGPDSDVDLFVDYDPETFDFVHLIRLGAELSRVLGRSADLTTRDGLHPVLRDDKEAEAIRVF
jgi:uncharacterized protein